MSFSAFMEPRRRGFLLAILNQSGQQGASTAVLKSMAHQAGYRLGEDALQVDLATLTEMGLVSGRTIGATQLISITPRGQDVATGQMLLPNIERVDL